jgi:hypothetical protein
MVRLHRDGEGRHLETTDCDLPCWRASELERHPAGERLLRVLGERIDGGLPHNLVVLPRRAGRDAFQVRDAVALTLKAKEFENRPRVAPEPVQV